MREFESWLSESWDAVAWNWTRHEANLRERAQRLTNEQLIELAPWWEMRYRRVFDGRTFVAWHLLTQGKWYHHNMWTDEFTDFLNCLISTPAKIYQSVAEDPDSLIEFPEMPQYEASTLHAIVADTFDQKNGFVVGTNAIRMTYQLPDWGEWERLGGVMRRENAQRWLPKLFEKFGETIPWHEEDS